MYKREFENLLKRDLPRAVLIYGENSYLISLYINYYIKKTDAIDTLRRDYYDDYNLLMQKLIYLKHHFLEELIYL